jgi:mono/diheme cytochrome c family protein
MKFTFAVTAFVGLIGRCEELPIDHWHGHHPPPPAADDDAGVDEDSCGPAGLYADRFCKRLEKGLIPYSPRYELWSDGADKQRFIFLPEGKQIDTSNPDRWNFPKGTRFYKTFSLDGKRLETRVFEKIAEPAGITSWTYVAYAWGADQRSVELVPDTGAEDVLGTRHNIPAQADCVRCHDQTPMNGEPVDIINGFEAIQLNHDGRGWTLARLIANDRLLNVQGSAPDITLQDSEVPGTRVDQAALGYLHANCGNCHGGELRRGGLDLSLHVDDVELSDTAAYQVAANCAPLTRWTGRVNEMNDPYLVSIEPSSAATSGVIGRMRVRGRGEQMPPIGTEVSDDVGIEGVTRWIEQLDLHCDPPPTPTPLL